MYIYSIALDEVIEGILEGYVDETSRRYKILQYIEVEEAPIRHIVSYVYTFATYEEALLCKEENSKNTTVSLRSGNIVYLLDKLRNPVSDRIGEPCRYQVVSVYTDTGRVGLVTSYGEYIGLHDISQVLYVGEGPLFKKEEYKVGTKVVWLDEEDVYEGIISTLNDNTATIRDIKKLFPLDYKIKIPYWKIPDGRVSSEESTSHVIYTIIGDDLN